jgi:hypothetical protein
MRTANAIKKALADRRNVALDARYRMVNCSGEFPPEAEAIYEQVMLDDEVYAHWRNELNRIQKKEESFFKWLCLDPALASGEGVEA